MDKANLLREVVNKFFEGKDYFSEYRKDLGHIWVAKHTGFQTLTIEPKEGGQYEIAVRIYSEDKWRGYQINDLSKVQDLFMVGINTRGH